MEKAAAMDQQKTNETLDLVQLIQNLASGRVEPLKLARRATIAWALSRTEGNVALAADMLRTSRSTVYRCARAADIEAA